MSVDAQRGQGVAPLGTDVSGGCDPSGYEECNLGPLKEQYVFLTVEPSNFSFLKKEDIFTEHTLRCPVPASTIICLTFCSLWNPVHRE